MANEFISIKIDDKKFKAALAKFPRQVERYMAQAGQEAVKRVILPTEGLQAYPHETAANHPPVPFYIRGRGTEYKRGNDMRSERLGSQWYVANEGISTIVGNRASYAIYVHGDRQAGRMANIGWRKLKEVAQEKLSDVTRIYNAWVTKLLGDIGLR